jgi:hypothetical protein
MMAGGNLLTLQKLPGHSDISMTLRYAHLRPDHVAGEIARMTFAPPVPADDDARRAAACGYLVRQLQNYGCVVEGVRGGGVEPPHLSAPDPKVKNGSPRQYTASHATDDKSKPRQSTEARSATRKRISGGYRSENYDADERRVNVIFCSTVAAAPLW